MKGRGFVLVAALLLSIALAEEVICPSSSIESCTVVGGGVTLAKPMAFGSFEVFLNLVFSPPWPSLP